MLTWEGGQGGAVSIFQAVAHWKAAEGTAVLKIIFVD